MADDRKIRKRSGMFQVYDQEPRKRREQPMSADEVSHVVGEWQKLYESINIDRLLKQAIDESQHWLNDIDDGKWPQLMHTVVYKEDGTWAPFPDDVRNLLINETGACKGHAFVYRFAEPLSEPWWIARIADAANTALKTSDRDLWGLRLMIFQKIVVESELQLAFGHLVEAGERNQERSSRAGAGGGQASINKRARRQQRIKEIVDELGLNGTDPRWTDEQWASFKAKLRAEPDGLFLHGDSLLTDRTLGDHLDETFPGRYSRRQSGS